MNNDVTKILLTGGHGATTGIAVIEEIKKQYPASSIFWIGTNSTISGHKSTSTEYKIYPTIGVKYFSIKAGKLQTKFTRYTIPLLLMIPVGFLEALNLVLKIRPKVILSFGGYSSFPVVFWGWVLKIPIVLHEQTVVAGRASISSSFFARKIALSRIESLKYFPKSKSVVTGNPVMENILNVKQKLKPGSAFTILVMGGSRGSEFINKEIAKIQSKLISKYKVFHITGERDYDKYKGLEGVNYHVEPFVDPREMASYYEKSDLIISRSGANTVSELLIVKRPVILIPLPKTFMNEQVKNAKYAEEFGIAKVMLESDVNSDSLMAAIETAILQSKEIVENVSRKVSPDLHAASKVVQLIEKYL